MPACVTFRVEVEEPQVMVMVAVRASFEVFFVISKVSFSEPPTPLALFSVSHEASLLALQTEREVTPTSYQVTS